MSYPECWANHWKFLPSMMYVCSMSLPACHFRYHVMTVTLAECVCCRCFPDPLLADRVHWGNPSLLPGDCTGTVYEAGRGLCLEHRTPF